MSTQLYTVAVKNTLPARVAETKQLAHELQLPVIESGQTNCQFILVYTEDRLELQPLDKKICGPVCAEFVTGRTGYRRVHGGGRRQLIARAVGLKKNFSPKILDATAGLGRDGFILACLGCEVVMVERSPVIAALLEDGLKRAAADESLAGIIQGKIQLIKQDCLALLGQVNELNPDVIYLDPMYPHRDKSALVKKEMRVLRQIVGDDCDAPALLVKAIATGKKVVVKRPKDASAITGPKPAYSLPGKKHRYDIYLGLSRHS